MRPFRSWFLSVFFIASMVTQAPANANLLAQATWNSPTSNSFGFELSYQLAATYNGYSSIGELVLIAPWIPDKSTFDNGVQTWRFDSPADLSYVASGIANTASDFWFITIANSIWVVHDECVTGIGSATVCWSPVTPNASLNGTLNRQSLALSAIEFSLGPVQLVNGISVRPAALGFYDSAPPVPEPGVYALMLLGLAAIAETRRRRAPIHRQQSGPQSVGGGSSS